MPNYSNNLYNIFPRTQKTVNARVENNNSYALALQMCSSLVIYILGIIYTIADKYQPNFDKNEEELVKTITIKNPIQHLKDKYGIENNGTIEYPVTDIPVCSRDSRLGYLNIIQANLYVMYYMLYRAFTVKRVQIQWVTTKKLGGNEIKATLQELMYMNDINVKITIKGNLRGMKQKTVQVFEDLTPEEDSKKFEYIGKNFRKFLDKFDMNNPKASLNTFNFISKSELESMVIEEETTEDNN